jgi:hypothetical protein
LLVTVKILPRLKKVVKWILLSLVAALKMLFVKLVNALKTARLDAVVLV